MANLTQLRVLEGLNGFLLVDKPVGIAFSTVVKSVKRKFSLVKVGHGGALDASSSGLLVLMLNDANRHVGDIMGADRTYTGRLRFGGTTNTGDAQGAPVENPKPVALADLKGDIFQSEPRFCAVRREGSSEYEVVETGDHAPTLGHVYRFDLTGEEFHLRATKGILPRALAYDLGATLVALRRTGVGKLKVEDAIMFERLLELEPGDLPSVVLPASKVLA